MPGDAPSLRTIAIAVVCDGGEVLVTRRPPGSAYAGMDEFPGGHVEGGESLGECVQREVHEETGLEVEVVRPVHDVAGAGPAADLHLYFFECRLVEKRPVASALPTGARWVRRSEVGRLQFPPANQRVVTWLAGGEPP